MMYFCTKCSMEGGVTSWLEEAGGVLVCKLNPKHRFKVDDSGFIHSVE